MISLLKIKIRYFLLSRDEMINYLQRDYEYLQTFLLTNIGDHDIVILLNKSSALEQIAKIIDLLRTGDKNGSNSSSMIISFLINQRFEKMSLFIFYST